MTDVPTAREFFGSLSTRARGGNTAGMTNSYLFEIAGAGTWHVVVDDGEVRVTEGERDADARISMSEDTFQKLLAREQNPMRAFFTGKIKVTGDMGAAAKLQKLLG
jgi:putative sterol carrier protein